MAPLAHPWQAAAALAAKRHAGQTRKDGVTPYASHPYRVTLTLLCVFNCQDDVATTAALLHDLIEDTPADFDEIIDALSPGFSESFARQVAEIVAALSKDARLPETDREPAYDRGLAQADPRARLIKLADVYDNLSDTIATQDATPDRVAKTVEKARRAIALCRDRNEHEDAAASVEGLIAKATRG